MNHLPYHHQLDVGMEFAEVEETIQMIEEFGLDEKRVYDRVGVQMAVQDDLAQSCPLGGEHSRS